MVTSTPTSMLLAILQAEAQNQSNNSVQTHLNTSSPILLVIIEILDCQDRLSRRRRIIRLARSCRSQSIRKIVIAAKMIGLHAINSITMTAFMPNQYKHKPATAATTINLSLALLLMPCSSRSNSLESGPITYFSNSV